jgi:tetratricopeptide (TPR) repeat protein
MSERRQDRLTALAIAGVALVVFGAALNAEFVTYDDPDYVTANSHVRRGLNFADAARDIVTFDAANWHPLTWLSLQLDASLWKTCDGEPDPRGFHLTNVLCHAASAAFLFLALRALTGAYWRSAAAALLFAVHPLRVESVAWVAERKDVLATFFGVLGLYAYAAYVAAPSPRRSLAVAGCYVLSLLSKPSLVALPFLLLVLDWWPLGRLRTRNDWRSLPREKLPLFVLCVLSCVLTFEAQARGGATQPLAVYSLPVRMENALVSYVVYLAKTFWPFDLAPLYPHPGASLPAWQAAAAAVFLASVVALAVALRQRAPYLLAGWLWYLGMLVPAIGLVQVGEQAYADRYTYFPQVGILLAVCWAAADLARRYTRAALAVAALAALALIVRTTDQLRHWHDSAALWQHALNVTPENATTLVSLGVLAETHEQFDRAEQYYRRAIEVDSGSALAELNLGTLFARQGKREQAAPHLERACELAPTYATARVRLGQLRLEQGNVDDAVRQFEEALRLVPAYAEAYMHLARVALARGQSDRAAGYLQQALASQPDCAEAHYWLAKILFASGHTADCMSHLRQELQTNPQSADARLLLGQSLDKLGDFDGAAREYAEAGRLDPHAPQPWFGLGMARARQGRVADAEAALRRALELEPESQPYKAALAAVLDMAAAGLAREGRLSQAAETERQARELAAAAGKTDMLRAIDENLRRYEGASAGGNR